MASKDQKKSKRSTIKYTDPGKMLDLIINLFDDTSAAIQAKINEYLMEVCGSETVLMIVVFAESMEASLDAVSDHMLSRKHKIFMTPKLVEIYKNRVAHTKIFSNFSAEFQNIVTPLLPKNSQQKDFLMVPIHDKPFSVIVCIGSPSEEEKTVVGLVNECFAFVWPNLKKTIALEYERTLKQKCQQLLKVTKRLFTQVGSLETLMQIAMEQAKLLTKAEYCLVKMVDAQRMELTEIIINKQENDLYYDQPTYPMDVGIVGQVLKTGALFNCKNAKDHSKFSAAIDAPPNVECKALLCFPIREKTGIIAVGQLVNKVGDPYFDSMDEEMALAFSIYCGVCIMHSVLFRKIHEAHVRNALANELVMYHMKVGDSEVNSMLECPGNHDHPQAANLHLNLRLLPNKELPCYAYKFFSDLGLDKRFKLKNKKLARFILHVKKGYRDVPYHNWYHAFNVAQWAYATLKNFKLVHQGYLSELQALMFLVAGLVHDLDHRGTTNSFQIHGQTSLAALYSSEGSVMERHHLAQAMCILNTEGCDILDGLTRRDYDRAIQLLRDFILASDLANYFKNLHEYTVISKDFQKNNKQHNAALVALLMNGADLSDTLKDWQSVKHTAAHLLTEFFKQGDVEKNRGVLPMAIMDRDKCFIPDLEIQFLTVTCIPLYNCIGRIIPEASKCVTVIISHLERWEASRTVFEEVPITGGLSVLLSPELDTLIELNIKEKLEKQQQEAEAGTADAEAKEDSDEE